MTYRKNIVLSILLLVTLLFAQETDNTIQPEPINVDGMILDSLTGEVPLADMVLTIGNDTLTVDENGEFSAVFPDTSNIGITVVADGYGRFSQELQFDLDNRFYFVTVQLSIQTNEPETEVVIVGDTTTGMPWTITGSITDSRIDEAIEDSTALLFFDGEPVEIGRFGNFKEGRFRVTTVVSGEHTFELSVDGYHTVYNKIILTENNKNIYHIVSTTELEFDHVRREMIVTASADPIHETSGAAKITLTRKDLQRTSATMTDPIRVLQTLPGVASQSDASARPIVRGGDVLESRVFIDGIPLIQPYHFGGVRSIFNQSAVENLTLYKSGFPSKYHDAQSAIITVDSRNPITEKPKVTGDFNLMQYNAYVGIPIVDEKFGIYVASQGSYTNAVFKAGWATMSRFNEDDKSYFKQQASYINLPDYQDVSGGLRWNINEKLNLSIHESFNTDRVQFVQADTMVVTNYHYNDIYYYEDTVLGYTHYYHELTGNPEIDSKLRDTSFSKTVSISPELSEYWYYGSYDEYVHSWEPIPYFQDRIDSAYMTDWHYDESTGEYTEYVPDSSDIYYYSTGEPNYDSYSQGDRFLDLDTNVDYKSRYNILHANLAYTKDSDNQFDFKLAWQKRWWEVGFPDVFSYFIPESKYDVHINQFNGIMDWTNTRLGNHTFNSGVQIDLTISDYDVYTPRALHEIITRGNTNFGDFWGPMSGDTGVDLASDSLGWGWSESMIERLLVKYKGDKTYLNGSLFFEDDWKVTDQLRLTLGTRFEVSSIDTSISLSPRITSNYSINETSEFTASVGLFTQNNYDISVIALSEVLKPEKVWHVDLGYEKQILPWLTQKVNVFGKYYYDLASEQFNSNQDTVDSTDLLENLEQFVEDNYDGQSLEDLDYDEVFNAYIMSYGSSLYSSYYTNSGRGYAYGLEYLLQYNPRDYWNGWISFTLQKAERERHPGWRWHTFPLSRPFMFSWVNYYRLPRKYELGLKYRYMSGLPYTEIDFDNGGVGPYNAEQYAAYNRIDMRISKGITIKQQTKMHLYLEVWNAFNTPNMFYRDKDTKKTVNMGFDLPATALFLGLDWDF